MKFGLSFLSSIVVIMILGVFLPPKTGIASSVGILVNMVPESPAPGEKVNINLSSYSSDLDSVLISWSVNGKNTSSGVGKKSFSVNAPKAGEETSIIATVSLPEGAKDIKVIIRPSVMVLLSQAKDSYVPPFYKGKAMPSPSSTVKVVALPEIRVGSSLINPKNMTYFWKKDYINNQDGSGYGKNSFTYVNDYLEDSNNIGVVASTIDQKYSSTANINIGTTKPKIVFYKNDPNFGILWEQALSDGYKIISSEILEAAPYFISPSDIRIPILTWDWFINDEMVSAPILKKNTLPLQVQAGISGTSKIRLEINNTEKIFESASKEINIEF